ncbi:hypothetical protein M758_10G169300 [Ceratodon purpureus]|nr:hypothetical protein M758_10G169300 [Ceratodon purpureus]
MLQKAHQPQTNKPIELTKHKHNLHTHKPTNVKQLSIANHNIQLANKQENRRGKETYIEGECEVQTSAGEQVASSAQQDFANTFRATIGCSRGAKKKKEKPRKKVAVILKRAKLELQLSDRDVRF